MNKNYCGANIKDFKVGDKVICIDTDGLYYAFGFELGGIYKVTGIKNGDCLTVEGRSMSPYSERFKKLDTQLELF